MNTEGPPTTPPRGSRTLASRGIQPRFSELGQRCRKLVLDHLADNLQRTFAQVDDALFRCAENAENNQVQTLFFDSMRSVRRLRAQIERHYHLSISRGIADFLDGKLADGAAAPTEVNADDLALVRDEDYEETLQVANMASRVQSHCAQALFALERRLALLNNGQPLPADSNPVAPKAIAQAFLDALAPCELPLRIKLVLYGLFDRQLMHGLDTLYDALNRTLMDAGVLPNLTYTATRSAQPARRPPPSDSPSTAVGDPPRAAQRQSPLPDLDAAPPANLDQLVDGVGILLAEYRKQHNAISLLSGTPSMASFAPPGARRTYDAEQLLAALDHLQKVSASELAQRLDRPQQVVDLKAALHRQLAAHGDTPQQCLGEREIDVIDLVGMLFDFMLDDDNLPQPYKLALSHLHTVYLKVALLDKALFTRRHHPARQLLDAMAKAGVLYGAADEPHGLLTKVHWVVKQVTQHFAGDLQLFEELLKEFNAFIATLKQRVDLQERRAVETAKGRDKLLDARHMAARVIAQSLAKRSLPPIIRHFLERTWIDVLVFIQLRYGPASDEWQRASETAEQLAWSGTRLDAEQHGLLQHLRVEMLEELHKGLMLLGGHHDDGVRRLLQDLVACQHAVQAGQHELACALTLPPGPSPLGAMLGEDAVRVDASQADALLSTNGQRLVNDLEKIECGTWFEFLVGQRRQALKLSWYSPATHNYLFVDLNGQRAAVKSLSQLAREMELGTARLGKADRTAPMVDRALTAVYRVLQQLTGRTAQT
ncbi:Protein of unknown function [Pseudomonas flavescens]|uniref:Thymidine phosphorylase n=1 Tax=Phytopseudomonas flavescens TaxID=29435 RepID=A0A1G8FVF4_9GAMM|nr:DUF1631 domain-containing protein [Pseudomonas flavescens]SDH86085.1 Protein of unknown function [Pseudomonas flavescens]